MTPKLLFKRSLLAAWLAAALAWPPACGDSTEAGSGSGGFTGGCVVDGQICQHGCDPNLGCVQCEVDADCGAAQPICVAGECEECGVSSDCGTGQACFPRNHECQSACQSATDCDHPDEPLCDPDTGACVGCLDGTDCSGEAPLCSNVTQQCVECLINDHCGVAQPICDIEAGRCRECLLDSQCAPGQYCNEHHCVAEPTCEPGTTACGDWCVDLSADPNHCGGCGDSCGDREYCDGGSCECRPGLTELPSGACVDLLTDPDSCGSPGNSCDGGLPQCQAGDCVDGCSAGFEECDNACVNLQANPLHCGDCGEGCAQDELCINGSCREYGPATGCSSCPCSTCGGDLGTCCSYPGDTGLTICVEGGECL